MELFKYVNEERIDILESGLVRFTQPQAFNDPFELNPHISSLADEPYLDDSFNSNFETIIIEEYEQQPESFKSAISLLQYRTYAESKKDEIRLVGKNIAEHATPFVKNIIDESVARNIGILSLTEDSHNLLMWAHYANSHGGFVIGLDSQHEFFDQRKSEDDGLRCLKKLKYNNSRPSLILSNVKSLESFMIKGDIWEYEKEWRMALSLKESCVIKESQPYDIHLFRIPFEAFRSVLIGARATEKTKAKIRSIVESNTSLNHINIFQMKVHDTKFKLEKCD
ncbi:MAG: DUF2971 domain-containing protein [Sedimenticola sp.]